MKIEIETYFLPEAERVIIITCINENAGTPLVDIAKILGISERTLYRKLEDYGIKVGRKSFLRRKPITEAL